MVVATQSEGKYGKDYEVAAAGEVGHLKGQSQHKGESRKYDVHVLTCVQFFTSTVSRANNCHHPVRAPCGGAVLRCHVHTMVCFHSRGVRSHHASFDPAAKSK